MGQWCDVHDPLLITVVNRRLVFRIHYRFAAIALFAASALVFSLGAGMMAVVVGITPAMIKTNKALDSCMGFEERIRKKLEGKILGAHMEVESLRATNLVLVKQLQDIQPPKPTTPERPTKNVGGYP